MLSCLTTKFNINMFELISALKSIGLSEPAAQIYLAGLELGPCSIQALSQKAKIKRTTIYGLLKELEKHDLITIAKDGAKNKYAVTDPEHLEKIEKNRMADLQVALPQLKALWQAPPTKPKIRFLEGKNCLQELSTEIENSNQPYIHIAGQASAIFQTLGRAETEATIKRKDAKGIKRKILVAKELASYSFIKTNPNPLREYRFLPNNIGLIPTQTYLYADSSCAFVTYEPNLMIVIIDNKAIYKTQMILFEALWEKGVLA